MKTYRAEFKKVVYGWVTIEAKNLKEAQKKLDSWDIEDEFDNKCEYEWGDFYED